MLAGLGVYSSGLGASETPERNEPTSSSDTSVVCPKRAPRLSPKPGPFHKDTLPPNGDMLRSGLLRKASWDWGPREALRPLSVDSMRASLPHAPGSSPRSPQPKAASPGNQVCRSVQSSNLDLHSNLYLSEPQTILRS